MATPEQIKRQQEFNKLQAESIRLSRSYADEARRLGKVVFDNNEARNENNRIQRETQRIIKEIQMDLRDVEKGEKSLNDLTKTQNNYRKFANSFTTEYKVLLQTILGDSTKVSQVMSGQVEASRAIRDIGGDNVSQNLALNSLYEDQAATLQMQANAMEEMEKRAVRIAKGAGGVTTISDSMSKFLQQQGLGGVDKALGLGDAAKEARKLSARLTEGGSKSATIADRFKIGGKFIKSMGSNLTKALGPAAGIAFILSKLVEAFTTIDKRAGETAKSLSISYNEALALDKEMTQVAQASSDSAISSKEMVGAQIALNQALGTSVKFSGEFAENFAKVQKRLGLSAEAMKFFGTQALVSGTNVEDQLQDISTISQELNFQNKISLTQKEVEEAIASVSKANLLTSRRSTEELTRQVFQSKLLGISMSQLESVSRGLLDFESSIGAEMEAELLTGKQLNLETARRAALNGDLATVASEMRQQIGDSADFAKLNVIQQEALAKAVGMTREELAGALVEQENLNALQDAFGSSISSLSGAQAEYNRLRKQGLSAEEAAAKIGDENLANRMESLSVQERMNDIMAKFSDLFIGLIEPMMPLVDGLISLIQTLQPFMGTITGAISGLVLSGGNPIGALIGGALGAGADISRSSGPKSSVQPLATGGIVTKPTLAMIGEGGESEAVVPLSKAQSLGFGGGNQETNRLLRELITAVNQGGDVYMDGAKVGKSLALSTSKIG